MTITKAQIITWSLLAVVAIIGILFLFRVFGGPSNTDNSQYLNTIKAQNEAIKAIQDERAADKIIEAEKNKSIEAHRKNDSAILQTIVNNQYKYRANDQKYQNIPIAIRSLSTKDSLRRAIAEP